MKARPNATSFPVNRAAKTRTICDLEILKCLTPKDISGAVIVNECVLTVEKVAFGKDPSERHETSSLFYYRIDYDISAAA